MDHFTEDEHLLVGLAATSGVGPATLQALLQRNGGRVGGLAAAVRGRAGAGLRDAAGLSVGDACRRGRAVCRRVAAAGGRTLVAGRPGYPARLDGVKGPGGPPVLFARGNTDLLTGGGAALFGSRRPTTPARRAARRLAAQLAAAGEVVISGGARGIDTAAHGGALEAGATLVVAPVGLLRFRWRGLRPRRGHAGRWCVVSQFAPSSGWQNAHALMRNALIAALGEAVLAFEPRDTGGTWSTCRHALVLGRPLFVLSATRTGAHGRGLRRLVRAGAWALDPAHLPTAAELRCLIAGYRRPASPTQGRLFDPPSLAEGAALS